MQRCACCKGGFRARQGCSGPAIALHLPQCSLGGDSLVTLRRIAQRPASQCSYCTCTALVRHVWQPARAVAPDREWNKGGRPGDGFPEDGAPKEAAAEVEPDWATSGKLAEESNTVRGVVLLHGEPPEARKPGLRWRLYTFKNGARAPPPAQLGFPFSYLDGVETHLSAGSKVHGMLAQGMSLESQKGSPFVDLQGSP